ncbi:DUF1615 family protein [Klebsiella grimontii]
MAVASSRFVSLTLTLVAGLVLSACSSKPEPVLKEGEKPIDVAAVVRQKMPASVKDREAWAQAIAKTFASQKLAPTEENVCSVLAVAQQESNYQSDPAVPGLNKIAWQEIDRRAEKMHIPVFLVHTALKIKSPNGKSYSERLDSVKTEKQLSAIFDDFIGMVPMGQKLFGSLNPVHTGGPMQVDGAYVWAPAVNALEKEGTVLTDSSQVGEWGAPTLDVWVVRKDFAEKHPDIVKAFAKSAIDAQQPYIANPDEWLKQPENISKLARLSGVPEADVPGLVKGNTYLTAAQQAQELNGPVNKAIIDTAKFLKEQGKVPAAGSDYSQYVTDRFVK